MLEDIFTKMIHNNQFESYVWYSFTLYLLQSWGAGIYMDIPSLKKGREICASLYHPSRAIQFEHPWLAMRIQECQSPNQMALSEAENIRGDNVFFLFLRY